MNNSCNLENNKNLKLFLIKKISNIKNKINLKCIYDIISENNKNIDFIISKNTDGVYINFGILSDETYTKINNFIVQNVRTKNKKYNDSTNYYIPHIENEYPFESSMKYSNKEKILIKRKIYDKELSESNEEQNILFNKK